MAMISPLSSVSGQQYTTTTRLVPVQQQTAPTTQIVHVQQRPEPQVHQQLVSQQQPVYSEQQQQAIAEAIQQIRQQQQQQGVQPQQIVQTRIIHVNHHRTVEDVPSALVRQFVTFKNLRHLNQPGQQWEHCEHITIALNPDEMERKIRAHGEPGNDLIRNLSSMGVYRQRHVRKYEDKLNNREPDPSNWSWVLEALGEIRDKAKSTPHTFWAIFQRIPRTDNMKQSRQVRIQPQVTIHHEPAHVVEATPNPATQQILTNIPQVPAPPPQQIALPAPPVTKNQQPHQPQYATQAAIIQPAQSIDTTSSPTYRIAHRSAQHLPAPVTTQQQRPNTAKYVQHQQHNQPRIIQQQSPKIYQQQQTVQTTTPHSSTPHTTIVRQITNGGTGSPVIRNYVRPIPTAYNPVQQAQPTYSTRQPETNQFQTSETSPSRFQEQVTRERSYDGMSDDSNSSYSSSTGSTSMADYALPKRRAPLGNTKTNSASRSPHQYRHSREGFSRRSSSRQRRALAPVPAPVPPTESERQYELHNIPSARITTRRENSYNLEVKFDPVPASSVRPARPEPIRRYSDMTTASTPRAYTRNGDSEDSEDDTVEVRYGTSRSTSSGIHGPRRKPASNVPRATPIHGSDQMPGAFNGNDYQAAGLVSYGPNGQRVYRRV